MILLIILLLVSQQSLITYDSGYFDGFSATCTVGYQETKTITFNGNFYNIPQIFLGLEYFDSQYPTEFRITIQNVQKTSFDLFVSCYTTLNIYSIKYYWYAIDDDRIQVINSFNNLLPDDQTFNHQIPNASKGIISIISFGVKGSINFQLSITSLTSTQVSVDIDNPANLRSLGYQVIIGVAEAFPDIQIIQHTTTYSSGVLTQYPKSWLFLGYCGMAQTAGQGFRQKFVRTSISESYTVSTFYGPFIIAYHVRSWITYQFTTYKAFECYTVRISQLFDLEEIIKPQIFIDIMEVNQSFSSSSTLIIDKPIKNLTVRTYMKCVKSKKIISKFLKCETCPNQNYYQLQHYCHGTINEINYFPKFQINQSAYKEINIEILSDKITITQILRNQVVTNKILLQIQIQA